MTRRTYPGHAASHGTALGFLHRTDRPPTHTALPRRTAGDPVQQVTDAFDSVASRLLDLSTTLRDQGKDEQADIMEVNSYIALDPDLRGQAIQRTRQGLPVPVAIRQAVDSYAGVIAALPDPTLAERATDVRQVGRRVLAQPPWTRSAPAPAASAATPAPPWPPPPSPAKLPRTCGNSSSSTAYPRCPDLSRRPP